MFMVGLVPAIIVFDVASPVFRKIVWTVIVVPFAAIIIVFAEPTAIGDGFVRPLFVDEPGLRGDAAAFRYRCLLLILGVLFGGPVAWFGQARWRRAPAS